MPLLTFPTAAWTGYVFGLSILKRKQPLMISKQGGVWTVLDDLTHSFAQNEAFIFSFCLCNLVRKHIFITYWCGLCFIVTYLTNAYFV